MSKRYGIPRIHALLSGLLNWCKRTAESHSQGTDGSRNGEFDAVPLTNVSHLFQADFRGQPMELKRFVNGLSIGDRIRVLCDDGVLVAEKISETQFKLVHSQMMSKFVH